MEYKNKILVTIITGMTLYMGYCAYNMNKVETISELTLANIEALSNTENSGTVHYCWTQFIGGLAWPKQCSSCIRLPFATGVGTAGTCTSN